MIDNNKNKNKMQTKRNLKKMYAKAVAKIFKNKNVVDVDMYDDDSMADYIAFQYEAGFPTYTLPELTQLLVYNSLLQTEAWTPRGVEFIAIYHHS